MPVGKFLASLFSDTAGNLVKDVGTQIRSFVTTKGDVMKNEDTLKELDEKILEVTNAHIEKMTELALSQFDSEVKDMENARNREIQIANSDKAPYINKIITPILALLVVGLCFTVWYIIIFKDIPQKKEMLVGGICGSVTSVCLMVMAYYFGSSSGSKAKTEQLNKMLGNS